jgi:hypothetical protein
MLKRKHDQHEANVEDLVVKDASFQRLIRVPRVRVKAPWSGLQLHACTGWVQGYEFSKPSLFL